MEKKVSRRNRRTATSSKERKNKNRKLKTQKKLRANLSNCDKFKRPQSKTVQFFVCLKSSKEENVLFIGKKVKKNWKRKVNFHRVDRLCGSTSFFLLLFFDGVGEIEHRMLNSNEIFNCDSLKVNGNMASFESIKIKPFSIRWNSSKLLFLICYFFCLRKIYWFPVSIGDISAMNDTRKKKRTMDQLEWCRTA